MAKAKLSKTLKKVLLDLGNESALKIAKVLIDAEGEQITDEKIAEDAELELKITRKILYVLDENDLTEFHRVRDKKTGWYSYFWNHSFDNLENFLQERRQDVINKLESRMKYEDNTFFHCEKCEDEKRYNYMEAMDLDFICPECNEGALKLAPNDETVKFLKEKIVKLRSYQ